MTTFTNLCDQFEELVDSDGFPSITDADLDRVEQTLNLRLPTKYRQFLLRCNGGVTSSYRVFGVNAQHYDLMQQAEDCRQYVPEIVEAGMLAVASDWGGNILCLDLAKATADDAPVCTWDHEAAEDPDEPALQPFLTSIEGMLEWVLGVGEFE